MEGLDWVKVVLAKWVSLNWYKDGKGSHYFRLAMGVHTN